MKPCHRLIGWAAATLLALVPAHGQLSIQATVFEDAGLFSYSYEIGNFTPNDVAIVTLGGLPVGADALQNLVAPQGFLALFDSDNGLLSLVEDTQSFVAGTSLGGFTFQSPHGPGSGYFEAIDILGNTLTGPALTPVATAIPEPSASALAAAVFAGLVAFRRRRARC